MNGRHVMGDGRSSWPSSLNSDAGPIGQAETSAGSATTAAVAITTTSCLTVAGALSFSGLSRSDTKNVIYQIEEIGGEASASMIKRNFKLQIKSINVENIIDSLGAAKNSKFKIQNYLYNYRRVDSLRQVGNDERPLRDCWLLKTNSQCKLDASP